VWTAISRVRLRDSESRSDLDPDSDPDAWRFLCNSRASCLWIYTCRASSKNFSLRDIIHVSRMSWRRWIRATSMTSINCFTTVSGQSDQKSARKSRQIRHKATARVERHTQLYFSENKYNVMLVSLLQLYHTALLRVTRVHSIGDTFC